MPPSALDLFVQLSDYPVLALVWLWSEAQVTSRLGTVSWTFRPHLTVWAVSFSFSLSTQGYSYINRGLLDQTSARLPRVLGFVTPTQWWPSLIRTGGTLLNRFVPNPSQCCFYLCWVLLGESQLSRCHWWVAWSAVLDWFVRSWAWTCLWGSIPYGDGPSRTTRSVSITLGLPQMGWADITFSPALCGMDSWIRRSCFLRAVLVISPNPVKIRPHLMREVDPVQDPDLRRAYSFVVSAQGRIFRDARRSSPVGRICLAVGSNHYLELELEFVIYHQRDGLPCKVQDPSFTMTPDSSPSSTQSLHFLEIRFSFYSHFFFLQFILPTRDEKNNTHSTVIQNLNRLKNICARERSGNRSSSIRAHLGLCPTHSTSCFSHAGPIRLYIVPTGSDHLAHPWKSGSCAETTNSGCCTQQAPISGPIFKGVGWGPKVTSVRNVTGLSRPRDSKFKFCWQIAEQFQVSLLQLVSCR